MNMQVPPGMEKMLNQATNMMQQQKQGSWDMVSLSGGNATAIEIANKAKMMLTRESPMQWRIEQIKDCYFLFYQKQS